VSWLLFLLVACGPKALPGSPVCDEMCAELVEKCEYAAFPTTTSCVQGCLYAENEGGDVKGQRDCVLEAECDTFDIVECEHEFGPESE
jgi:hypothetical protein